MLKFYNQFPNYPHGILILINTKINKQTKKTLNQISNKVNHWLHFKINFDEKCTNKTLIGPVSPFTTRLKKYINKQSRLTLSLLFSVVFLKPLRRGHSFIKLLLSVPTDLTLLNCQYKNLIRSWTCFFFFWPYTVNFISSCYIYSQYIWFLGFNVTEMTGIGKGEAHVHRTSSNSMHLRKEKY